MKFKLEIECDNEAFEEPSVEIVRILRCTARHIAEAGAVGKCLDIRDLNGNVVGQYGVSERQPS